MDVLTGSWRATLSNAWFLEPPDQEVEGTATAEWLADAFVVFRWTISGEPGTATTEMVLVIGRSDANDAYTALYHDERGVNRVFAMTFDAARWTMSRADPDLFQRFVADVTPGRVTGRWEASQDRGSTWRKDFDLVFERA
uniref:Noc-1 n=1 Tax=Nocardia sp. ATCC 202099 TaxID=930400 RepID=E5DUG0_9NOCA|nr:Noc-1 [Nocardia sp. ATCC 202099]